MPTIKLIKLKTVTNMLAYVDMGRQNLANEANYSFTSHICDTLMMIDALTLYSVLGESEPPKFFPGTGKRKRGRRKAQLFRMKYRFEW